MSAERVFQMRAPNGDIAEVAERDVDHFRKRGAVVVGMSREGRENWLADKIDDPATRHQSSFPRTRAFVAGTAQGAADLIEGAKAGLMSTAYHGGDLIRRATGMKRVIDEPEAVDAMTPPDSAAGKVGYTVEQGAEYVAPGTLVAKGAKAANAGRAALLGAEGAMGAGWAGVQTGGDPVAMTIGAVAPAAFTGVAKTVGAGAGLVRRAAAGARESGVGGAIGSAVRKVMPEDPFRMIVQAVKPRNSQVNFERTIQTAAPEVKAFAQKAGLPLDTIDDVIEATTRAKQMLRSQYDEVAGPYRAVGAAVDLTPVAEAMTASVPRKVLLETPELAEQIAARARAYRRPFKLEEAEQLLRETNADLEGYYAKFPGAQRQALQSDPAVAALEAQARTLRSAIYGVLDHPSLPPVARELNRRYGTLMEFEDTLLRRRNVANRQQPESLSEQIGSVRAAGETARGLWKLRNLDVSGLGDIAAARAGRATAKYLKEQQTTDALLRRAFANVRGAAPVDLPVIEQGVSSVRGYRSHPLPPARQPAGLLPSSTEASRTFDMPPSSFDESGGRLVDADRVVQRDPRGRMQRVYTNEDAGTAKGRAGTPYTPVVGGAKPQAGEYLPVVAGPAASSLVPDDPDSNVDDYARVGLNLGSTVAAGAMAARWFPKRLKTRLDLEAKMMRDRQLAEHLKAGGSRKNFAAKQAEIDTHVRNVIRREAGSAEEAQRLMDGYETIPLPVHQGVNFDDRRPLLRVLAYDKPGTATTTPDPRARGAKFSDFARKRIDLAYQAGVKRNENESWGDSRWLYHLTNGDPTAATQVTRLLGAFSPGQKTDANTLNAIEAFIRTVNGESPQQILGKKVAGQTSRVGATLSFAHPRPGTVEPNLERAIKLGRIFQEKVEALASAEVGIHDDIPIDMWLMRAIGAQSDTTPSKGMYRLISEAMAKEAKQRGENPFEFMAKVWMGMQDIAGANTPSFQASTSKLRLPGHLADPKNRASILQNIEQHGAAIRSKKASDVGEVSPIATNPSMQYPEFIRRTQDLVRSGRDRDVLGKVKVVKNHKPVTLADMARQVGAR